MKLFLLLTMLCVSLATVGQGNADAYSQKTEQEAIKLAYRILKVYYPENELCVSDSVYSLHWPFFSNKVDNKAVQDLISHWKEKIYHKTDHKSFYNPTVYSEDLDSIFGSEYIMCGASKYVADFSEPYKGMITCEVLPTDRKIGILGDPQITVFLFRYNEKGEIYQVSKSVVDID